MDRHAARRSKALKATRSAGADSLLVTNFKNVTYLTGFTGDDSYLLLTAADAILLTDPRYTTQLEDECPGLDLEVRQPGVSMLDALERVLKKAKPTRLGIEATSMTVSLRDKLAEKLPKQQLVPTSGIVEDLRMRKDKLEIDEIREAVAFAERGFAVLKASIRPEQTEKEVSDGLEHQLRLFGAKGASFETIVAVGERAALPHARPTGKKIGEAGFVLVDWGASGKLYKSDLTRILVTGRIPPKLERIYGVVLKAQLRAIAAIRPGAICQDVDAAAREVIEEAGYGPNFGHGLGHGIGLDIHEGPRLGRGVHQPLEPGMVVTVEPGIYLPHWGGVRIEDDVLVTKDGHEVLSSTAKRWEDTMTA